MIFMCAVYMKPPSTRQAVALAAALVVAVGVTALLYARARCRWEPFTAPTTTVPTTTVPTTMATKSVMAWAYYCQIRGYCALVLGKFVR